jgi:hypothetical protein
MHHHILRLHLEEKRQLLNSKFWPGRKQKLPAFGNRGGRIPFFEKLRAQARKAPNSKLKRSTKIQAQKLSCAPFAPASVLVVWCFEIWNFSGAWGFGAWCFASRRLKN